MKTTFFCKEGILALLSSPKISQFKIFYFNLKLEILCIKTIDYEPPKSLHDPPTESKKIPPPKIKAANFFIINSDPREKKTFIGLALEFKTSPEIFFYRLTLTPDNLNITTIALDAPKKFSGINYRTITRLQSSHNSTLLYQKDSGEFGLMAFSITQKIQNILTTKQTCLETDIYQHFDNSEGKLASYSIEISTEGSETENGPRDRYIIFVINSL